jgi:hypothetical protein
VPVFGWLDAKHLAYATARGDGAVVARIDVETKQRSEILVLAGEAITGGGVADGRIALLHGPIRHSLVLGTVTSAAGTGSGSAVATPAAAILAAAQDGALEVAGLDAGRQPIVVRAVDQPFGTRRTDGSFPPWPSAVAGDHPQTLAGEVVLGVRGGGANRGSGTMAGSPDHGAIWRFASEGGGSNAARQLATVAPPRGSVAVRCAGDVAAPCIVADGAATLVHYNAFDPDSGALGRRIADLGTGVDHAVSPDGAWLAIARGTRTLRIYAIADAADTKDRARDIGGGAVVDAVAWLDAQTLVVAARHWKQQPWSLLAVDADRSVRVLAQDPATIAAQVRLRGNTIAVAATGVTPELSVLAAP